MSIKDFSKWAATSLAGADYVYYDGRKPKTFNDEAFILAWNLYEQGKVALFQEKVKTPRGRIAHVYHARRISAKAHAFLNAAHKLAA